MKILYQHEAPRDARSDGRTVLTLLSQCFSEPLESLVFYLVKVPGGRFDKHYHTKAREVIWFPNGGKITVNDQTHDLGAWDGVLLEPGDTHSYSGDDLGDIIHFAAKMPAADDKVRVD
jgi:hypothetical protein